MTDKDPVDFDKLVREYDKLRAAEFELIKKRHAADHELQLTRMKTAKIAAEIASLTSGPVACW